MALFHRATLNPTKAEIITTWGPTQPWWPSGGGEPEVIGGFRFDDPEGRVGMETHMARVGDVIVQVPLTYRDEPLDDADDAFVGEMHHSALGTRWLYDGLADPIYLVMLTAVSMTGQGEALGLAVYDGRWFVAPTNVRIQGGGWSGERVPVDRMQRTVHDDVDPVYRSDLFQLSVHRQPTEGPQPAMGLTAAWPDQAPVVLAEVAHLSG